MFIYHFKRKNMSGNELIPLNRQKEKWPEMHKEHVKKYEGREKLLEKKIPILNCLWNDVLHFSPINPQLILDVYHKENLVPDIRKDEVFEVYKIPVGMLSEEKTVCFQSFNYDFDHYSPELDKYWKFSLSEFEELQEVPKEQIQIWHQDKKAGRVLFWYSHIMHVLSQTTLDISDCEILRCK